MKTRELKPQTPNPILTGMATNGTFLDNPEAQALWQANWERWHSHRWVARGSKLYPKQKVTCAP